MFTRNTPILIASILASSLAAAACTVDKGDTDTDASAGSSSSSGGATEEPTSTTATDGIVSGTSTEGDPDTSGLGEGGQPCIDAPTPLAVDEASPLGFSAAELLAGKLGPRSATLLFASEPLSLADAWKGASLPLTVELRDTGGAVRWIDSEPDPDYDDSGNDGGVVECVDRLEVNLALDFVTAGGEFDEHPAVTLTATSVARARLRVKLLPPGLAGSFDPAGLYGDPAWAVTGLEIFGAWDGALAGGSLMNEVQVGDDETGFVGFGGVAKLGDAIDPP